MKKAWARLLALVFGTLAIGFLLGMLTFNQPEPVVVKSPAAYTETVTELNGIKVR